MIQADLRGYLPDEGIQKPEFKRSIIREFAHHFFSVEYLPAELGFLQPFKE